MAHDRRRQKRNIPAHAGKTISTNDVDVPIEEHPRARGENRHRHPHRWVPRGTSPRTRGKRRILESGTAIAGNIPAHAGKTFGAAQGFVCRPEHPRARGENSPKRSFQRMPHGTSPRTRGKPIKYHFEQGVSRNIPAHAGKTINKVVLCSWITEHPRARGENPRWYSRKATKTGTSPRTRGKR